MKQVKYQKVEAVIGQNPKDYAEQLSKALYEHRFDNPVIDRVDVCVCYLTYFVEERIIETLQDQYEEEGCGMRCSECSYFVGDLNRNGEPLGNSKHGTCSFTNERVRIDARACARCYNAIEQMGGIQWLKAQQTEE